MSLELINIAPRTRVQCVDMAGHNEGVVTGTSGVTAQEVALENQGVSRADDETV